MARPRERGSLASAVIEVARAAATLGYYFGAMPWVAFRAAGRSEAEARALVLAHAARARRLGGIALEVEGAERLPARGTFVAVYNETGIVQDLANLELMSRIRIAKMVVAAEYAAIPLLARAASTWGLVFLRRHHREDVERTLAALVATLRAGGRVCIAPQGRFSPTVCHFKRGAFLIAIRAGVPVVPIGVRGGTDILPPRSARMHPGVLRYRVGAPISTAGLCDGDAPALAVRARREVLRLVRERTARRARRPRRARITARGRS